MDQEANIVQEETNESMIQVAESEWSRMINSQEKLRQENNALKEIIIRMTAERYLPNEKG